MKADGSLKTLLQGVSQQPTRDRLPGQCTEQVNMSSDPVKGLTRRPGSDLVGIVGSNDIANVRGWGTILTPDGKKCLVSIRNTGIRVFDYNAVEFPVDVVGDQSAYFAQAGSWSIASVKDQTYLANNGVVTAMLSTIATYWNNVTGTGNSSAIFQILGGAYGKTYSIYINGTLYAQHKTVDGTDPVDAQYVGTAYIANVLAWCLTHTNSDAVPVQFHNADGATFVRGGYMVAGSGWVLVQQDDVVVVTLVNSPPFTATISDDAGNINAKILTNSVPDVADLPRYAPHNYVVRVAKETDPSEDLWLHFVNDSYTTDGTGFGTSGAWYEAAAPGILTKFNPSTMPRLLTFNTTTQRFTLSSEVWPDRTVGTDTTNPLPSFIGRTVQDMAIFQSRLVFLAGTSWVASRSKKYTNFWIGSASTLTDADPIDITSQAAYATVLRYAVAHNKDMVMFSDSGQFVVFGRTALTPSNAALVLTTSFEADLTAKPQPSGRNVFFATKFGRYTGIREFYTEGGTDINDTRPITQHIKNYIVGGPKHLSSTSNFDHLLVHTDTDQATIYPYQFIWSDSAKVQSAWHKWVFSKDNIFSFFDDELIYFIINVGSEQYLLRMSLDIQDEVGVNYPMYSDAKFDVSGVNSAFALPYSWLNDQDLIVMQGEDCPHPGMKVTITSRAFVAGQWVINLREDMLGGNIVVGINFDSEYEPTMPRMKDKDNVVINNARMIINQFIITCEATGRILGQKLTKWGNSAIVAYEGYSINDADSIVGIPGISDRVFNLPFKEKVENGTIKIISDAHWPMTILDIEWEGTVNKRGQRISTGGSTN